MSKTLLEIEDLYARVGEKEIIKGFNLTINEGEVHAIMGPNGAGKSTLSYVLAGKPGYEVTSGSIKFKGKNLLAMSTEERAREGVFLCMQYPVEIPGVPSSTFMKHSVNAIRKHQNLPELDTMEFIKILREEGRKLGLDNEMIKRPVNVGFSGGEKKRAALALAARMSCSASFSVRVRVKVFSFSMFVSPCLFLCRVFFRVIIILLSLCDNIKTFYETISHKKRFFIHSFLHKNKKSPALPGTNWQDGGVLCGTV